MGVPFGKHPPLRTSSMALGQRGTAGLEQPGPGARLLHHSVRWRGRLSRHTAPHGHREKQRRCAVRYEG